MSRYSPSVLRSDGPSGNPLLDALSGGLDTFLGMRAQRHEQQQRDQRFAAQQQEHEWQGESHQRDLARSDREAALADLEEAILRNSASTSGIRHHDAGGPVTTPAPGQHPGNAAFVDELGRAVTSPAAATPNDGMGRAATSAGITAPGSFNPHIGAFVPVGGMPAPAPETDLGHGYYLDPSQTPEAHKQQAQEATIQEAIRAAAAAGVNPNTAAAAIRNHLPKVLERYLTPQEPKAPVRGTPAWFDMLTKEEDIKATAHAKAEKTKPLSPAERRLEHQDQEHDDEVEAQGLATFGSRLPSAEATAAFERGYREARKGGSKLKPGHLAVKVLDNLRRARPELFPAKAADDEESQVLEYLTKGAGGAKGGTAPAPAAAAPSPAAAAPAPKAQPVDTAAIRSRATARARELQGQKKSRADIIRIMRSEGYDVR